MSKHTVIVGFIASCIATPALAYLAPDEVFTDLELPEEPVAEESMPADPSPFDQEEAATDRQPASGSTTNDVLIPTLPPADPATTTTTTRTFTPPEDTQSSSEPAGETDGPVFYRAGKAAPVQEDTSPSSAPTSPFETETSSSADTESEISTDTETGTTVEADTIKNSGAAVETDDTSPDELEEDLRAAAPNNGNAMLGLLSDAKYILAVIAVALVAVIYFMFGRTPQKKTVTATGDAANPIAQQPMQGPKNTESTSPRLQQALKAMQKEELQKNVDKKDASDNDAIAFKDTE